jgi:hypothetical protein
MVRGLASRFVLAARPCWEERRFTGVTLYKRKEIISIVGDSVPFNTVLLCW